MPALLYQPFDDCALHLSASNLAHFFTASFESRHFPRSGVPKARSFGPLLSELFPGQDKTVTRVTRQLRIILRVAC
ncbi:hypothetical protein, partial [Roseibium denhamense]